MRLLVLLCILLTPTFVGAQIAANNLLETNLSITSTPEYPEPNENVELSLNDYGSNAYGAEVQWYLDEKPIPDTQNQRNIKLTVGDPGSKNTVRAVLTRSDGTKTTLTKVFEPVYVDIITEAETHVPGFFTGRPLPSVGSSVRLTALLSDGSDLGGDFIYLWRVNQTVLEGGPIRGRNTISFTMPPDTYSVVSLQVSKPDGTIFTKQSTIISIVDPQINFYEVNALYGVEQRSLDSFMMVSDVANIKAEPYYLDSNTFNSADLLKWTINNKEVFGDVNNPYIITLEKTGYPGQARLEFHVRNTTSLLQGARKTINISI